MELNFIKNFIDQRNTLVNEQRAKLKEVDDKLIADCKEYFLEHSNVKVGTHISIVSRKWDGSSKENYYKVSRIEADVNGIITIYGIKRKLNKEFGKREVNITCASIYDVSIPKEYKIINLE